MTVPPPPSVAAVVVLAAGQGTRMKSALPKVLHPLGGRSMLGHVLAAAAPLAAEHTVVVVGAGRETVEQHLAEVAPAARPVFQEKQRGSGHAAAVALAAVPAIEGAVLLVNGDAPLLRPETVTALVQAHQAAGNVLTVLTAEVEDPTGLGRIVRDADGAVRAIVEERDATSEQRALREINAGLYVGDSAALRRSLASLGEDNDQGEQYLTDVLGLLVAEGGRVGGVRAEDPDDVLGCNDRRELAARRRTLNDRVLDELMRSGVTVVDPATTWVDVTVSVAPDAVLEPGVQLQGATSVATGAVVGPDSTLRDTEVGEGASVVRSHVLGAVIGAESTVGPFSYLRPGTRLGRGAKVGAFVETKNADVGEGSKVPHLSYVGDATIGEGANIGAATVFVNYDGVAKHRTTIGDHVRIGSDTMLVAPVTVGDGAYTAAGSVIVTDVPPGAMAVARSPQRNVAGWVRRRRPGTAAAKAAEAAGDAEAAGAADTRTKASE
ncbi:bifunctional UDP-N-acetylglucosamine diphosphorylase/glucosamine-1-phosphate N-acetyltransferase GlmU [Geodermatophilus sabuli]|uniref:Bifunctional protein GlmU n=1 Tax=Geodermatophilus sabuli TaxID=1564158 RepID=A0A285EDE3_9ACTN|nr:bifunctional UDP-N-acetylglucosamine diphosphorylase/glucosamine-1-phosphate N-acetyltransferase GlmU [Geodermatophilus sabuli]MBB3083231.1 bifunctional UDP-N-acetylglucosamine pyrophosphorylase/glucosamine-1-phosphate N-acetyltransferase [Geodermatophilus sabuli]SNX97045.1 bifunctional UDP-N-acetylglucosamine pyrophosphorylase / Glucosamine-1-phosphate N-acetyltransferase [Geodermatophilus sabuli]